MVTMVTGESDGSRS